VALPEDPRFFRAPADFAKWLVKNHGSATHLWVGFHKVGSGKPSVTWPQSVDEALCVGWIDGVRKRIDEHSYKIRFSPRKSTSIWSANNMKRVAVLTEEGRMGAAGLKAFEARRENRSGIYAYEQRPTDLPEPYAGALRKHRAASKFFRAQPPWYRQVMSWWVVSAKREETRAKRIVTLIEACTEGRRLR
jgi:uncharacterized protein YdeI (YjbR/CyaY-like superfamily)